MRPSWDETWMSIAEDMSLRSPCSAAKVGSVIVDPANRPVSTGYNGPAANYEMTHVDICDTEGRVLRRDIPGCETWCQKRIDGLRGGSYELACPTIHAEANALMFADRRSYEGGTIYVTASCCADCAKLISNSGIHRVVMHITDADTHRDPHRVVNYLRRCGLLVDVV